MALDCSGDFGPFNGRVWLNCAHQGALPKLAADAAREAIGWKVAPNELTAERFSGVPARVRAALSRLVSAPPEQIVLANSASYGLHLIANGMPWRPGDEVLVVANDFPSDILPWLGLEREGVRVATIEPRHPLPEPDELRRAITARTRVFCTTWVHSFSGYAADLDGLGIVCRENGVRLVLNASQAIGARPLDVRTAPVDAITSAGFKWLCGPYGTGFCWMRPDLLESLQYNQSYWLAQMTATDLGDENREIRLPTGPPRARTFDIFGTANFFNFHPWAASIEYVLDQGIDRIAEHDQGLVDRLIHGLDPKKYEVTSPRSGPARSTLVLITHRDRTRNDEMRSRLADSGIDVAYRKGRVRFAPHLYNTADDIDRALTELNRL